MRQVRWVMMLLSLPLAALAETPAAIQQRYLEAARAEQADFQGFDALRGGELYRRQGAGGLTCGSCHGPDPRSGGRHQKTGKAIEPLSPAVNPQRFSDPAKVEKWFTRNCRDVLGRACSPQEKGDFMAYILSR